jgi:HD-like signal output (HDOD) protein
LINAMRNPDVGVREVAPIISDDLGMSAKILSLANSAFFGRGQPVTTVRGAISYLGMNTIKELVLSVEVFRLFEDSIAGSGLSLDCLQRHAVFVGDLCRRMLVTRPDLIEWASLAASLHDIGKLIMAARMPEQHAQALKHSRERECSFAKAEQSLHGITHAQLGAYLLGLWGFPFGVVDAVACHHGPFDCPQRELNASSAVAIANMLAIEVGISADPQAKALPEQAVDLDYVKACGLEQALPAWRQLAQKRAEAEKASTA